MLRLPVLALLALMACEQPAPPPAPTPIAYIVPPGPLAWTRAAEVARIGRAVAPAPAQLLGVAGTGAPLLRPTVWAIPGDGPARAAVYGSLEDKAAIEVIDIDAGRVVWRDAKTCTGPIVGVTSTAIVCADATGVRAVAVADGTLDWETEDAFLAMDGELVVIAAGPDVAVRRAGGGDEVAHLALPVGFPQATLIGACPERELFALDTAKVIRLVAAPGAPAKPVWMTATSAPPDRIDPGCGGPTILATSGTTLTALDRATGAIVGTLDGVRGWWKARDGRGDRIEVATATGVTSYDRTLRDPVATTLPPLGGLIAERGERRLVAAGPLAAMLLDRDGVRAYVPFGEQAGALGDRALLAGSWSGEANERVHRRALPEAIAREVVPPLQVGGTAVPAELRDLPAFGALGEELAASEPRGPTFVTIDPRDPATVIVKIVDGDAVATWRADLRARTWHATAACVVCVTRAGASRTVRGPTWSATGPGDYVEVGRDVAIWFADDRARVLDVRDGAVLGELASDDGTRPAIAIVERGNETWLVAAEHGAIVARLPRPGMLPVWSIGVAGVVAGIASAGDGVVVTLAEGDAYRIALRGPEVQAFAGLGLAFRVEPDLVAGTTLGGPLYGPRPPAPPPRRPLAPPPKQPPPIDGPFVPPAIATPVPLPPVIGRAFHLTVFHLDGSVRARAEYALRDAAVEGARSAGAPLVITHAEGALVVDPHSGDPLVQVPLLDGARVFSTVVDGTPFVGLVVGAPLRIIAIPVVAR